MLAVTVLGSGIAFLEATVVNVAVPEIGRDLGATTGDLQWILNGYLLTLSAFILLGGSLGDRMGRRLIFNVGIVWFTLASALCALAPSSEFLIAARVLQGVGGALLTPGSLAIIEATLDPEDRARAIGAWSGLGGVAAAIGPLLGGLSRRRGFVAVDLPDQPASRRLRCVHVQPPCAREHVTRPRPASWTSRGLSSRRQGLAAAHLPRRSARPRDAARRPSPSQRSWAPSC